MKIAVNNDLGVTVRRSDFVLHERGKRDRTFAFEARLPARICHGSRPRIPIVHALAAQGGIEAMNIPVLIAPLGDGLALRGRMVGLLSNDNGCDRCGDNGYSAVVAIDGHGIILSIVHPSRVTMTESGNVLDENIPYTLL